MTAAVEVFIAESQESWSTLTLTNGVKLRVKALVTSVHILDSFDNFGKSIVEVNGGLVAVVEFFPEELGPTKN